MAVSNIKAPRKTKSKPRSTKAWDMVNIGHLPKWADVESADSENFKAALDDALRHYGYFNTVKDLKSKIVDFLVTREFDKTTITAYKKSLDWRTPMTAASLAAAYAAGMPEYERATQYITDAVLEAVSHGDERVAEDEDATAGKKEVKKPSIQDRITAKVNEHILHFEEAFEDGIIERKEKHPAPDARSYLETAEVPPSMITRIVDHFQAQWDEIKGSQGVKADEQLKEAYAHLSKADVKRFTDFYKAVIVELEMYKEIKKVAKAPRARKAVSKTKQVQRLNFMKRHDGLKLVSIQPEDLVDCKEIWVYQTKYRKLGKYVAESHSTLGVKGTSITGFDVNGSVQKNLRKPAEQLAAFKKAGKVKLRTFMDEISAVDIKLTGRINKDTILLKAST